VPHQHGREIMRVRGQKKLPSAADGPAFGHDHAQ
jgi:hypothetical protein